MTAIFKKIKINFFFGGEKGEKIADLSADIIRISKLCFAGQLCQLSVISFDSTSNNSLTDLMQNFMMFSKEFKSGILRKSFETVSKNLFPISMSLIHFFF